MSGNGNALYFEVLRAENAWREELGRLFGSSAEAARKDKRGRGTPGTELRKRFDAFILAREQYREARETTPELMPYRT